MIIVPNIDSKIWNPESMIVDIIAEISQGNIVEISLNSEGPCAESLGLYRILDSICERFDYPKHKIIIHTINQLESHPEYNIRKTPSLHYVGATQNFFSTIQTHVVKSFNQDFCHFGIFIGRSNWVRLWLASIMQEKYHDKTKMTYHWKPHDEFHLAHIGLDDMLRWNANTKDINRASAFLSQCPLGLTEKNSYPILFPEHLNICKIYHRIFLEVVCETYFSGTSFHPTEKIWRPLMMKTPFIVHGPVDYLRNLKKLGFKTFDRWWSEEYDDYGHDLRIEKLLAIIEELAKMNLEDLKKIYSDMLPVLEHNHRLFMDLDKTKFQNLY